jgi:hypothetical protein
MTAKGHEDQFLPPRPSRRFWFSQRTFAKTIGNDTDAPISDLRSALMVPLIWVAISDIPFDKTHTL